MKRLIWMASVVLLLSGCVPTPKQEYIVNKADGTLENKLAAAPAVIAVEVEQNAEEPNAKPQATSQKAEDETETPSAAPVRFPEQWRETVQIGEKVTVQFDAPVEQKADGRYPVYRTRAAVFTAEDTERVAKALLVSPVSETTDGMTKDDWIAEFREYLKTADEQRAWVAAGKPSDGDRDETVWTEEEIEARSEEYAAAIAAAPERNETRPVSDFRNIASRTTHIYTLSSGERATLYWDADSVFVQRGGEGMYLRSQYAFTKTHPQEDDPFFRLWQDPSLSKEDASAMLLRTLETLGLTSFTVVEAEEANQFSGRTECAAGWRFVLHRDYGGYPPLLHISPATRFDYPSNGESAVNRPIGTESITAFVAPDGVRSFSYGHPKTVVGLENENVALLPFAKIQTLLKNAIDFGFARYNEADRAAASFTVYRAILTTYTLRVRDSEEYYEIPCWVFVFTRTRPDGEYGQTSVAQQAIVLNAVDGSLVRPDRGY